MHAAVHQCLHQLTRPTSRPRLAAARTDAKLFLQECHVLGLVLLQQLHIVLVAEELCDGLDRRLQALEPRHNLHAPRTQRVGHLREAQGGGGCGACMHGAAGIIARRAHCQHSYPAEVLAQNLQRRCLPTRRRPAAAR